ncbi:hypothetical protein SODALDRAFT_331754 [Sodiomyces alkalinus F11]|uniref:Vacuolar sorting protein Vps3844 C-terminal domain-containing protein n=1 Tax=Sodiomyces alkalinus (strain CBS 110278 / VKM F-3762 / F11) TaxID=1314773 RepID=A0A3N2PZ71_SODAK|nr:hypothetical protein SODALDRAFT_331754 [Sodiomyces alkalinus F11]ROT39645.1 hypothetical protein SODALDRAFT_331754 [Sodiomyces alkalinus F11]
MKVSLGVAAALAGLTTALQPQPADVYLLQSKPASSSEAPSIPRQLARLVLLQRLAPEGGVGSLDEIPDGLSDERAVVYLNQFGKAPQPLFDDAAASEPSQLLIMLEGITAEAGQKLKEALSGLFPAFRVSDTPSSVANRDFIQQDLLLAGVSKSECELETAINPLEEECFDGKASVASFDVKKDPSVLSSLIDNIARLQRLAEVGEMETTLLLLPETSRTSSLNAWTSKPSSARRQLAEEVMASSAAEDDEDDDEQLETGTSAAAGAGSSSALFSAVSGKGIPACFSSQDSCQSATGNCSGHGACQPKYAGSSSCFTCHCESTVSDAGSTTHWAGATCAKVDLSAPFWLFAGFTILMLGVVSLSLTMLFNLGEEKLPGVIGAGVSKSK